MAATSEASSLTFVTEPTGPDHFTRIREEGHLRQVALASFQKTSAAMGEEQKKEGDGTEHMEEDVVPENGQDKDAASGEDKGGGSGAVA